MASRCLFRSPIVRCSRSIISNLYHTISDESLIFSKIPRDSTFRKGKLGPSSWSVARKTAGPDVNFAPGWDLHHWQIWPKPLKGSPTKDDIIHYYINILSQVLPSEEQAVDKIYSVATRQYNAFGANVSPELADKLDDLPNVCYVVPDDYVDPVEKRYPWYPFINGQALPYDPKYYPTGVRLSLADEKLTETRQQNSLPNVKKNNRLMNARFLRTARRSVPTHDGCDFEHWQIYTEPLRGDPTKDEIIRYYIKILAQVLGSENEAVKKMYSVATRHYYAFGANVSLEIVDKMRDLSNVNNILPDLYVDPIEKRYPLMR